MIQAPELINYSHIDYPSCFPFPLYKCDSGDDDDDDDTEALYEQQQQQERDYNRSLQIKQIQTLRRQRGFQLPEGMTTIQQPKKPNAIGG